MLGPLEIILTLCKLKTFHYNLCGWCMYNRQYVH